MHRGHARAAMVLCCFLIAGASSIANAQSAAKGKSPRLVARFDSGPRVLGEVFTVTVDSSGGGLAIKYSVTGGTATKLYPVTALVTGCVGILGTLHDLETIDGGDAHETADLQCTCDGPGTVTLKFYKNAATGTPLYTCTLNFVCKQGDLHYFVSAPGLSPWTLIAACVALLLSGAFVLLTRRIPLGTRS